MPRPQTMPPSSTLQEATSDVVDKKYIQRRIADWEKRIGDLYRLVRSWLGDDFSFDSKSTIQMYEELMESTGVPARDLPVLTISRDGEEVGRLEPRGLWIIGVNGRLDLQCPAGPHLLLDVAGNFAKADWRIAPLSARQNMTKLSATRLAALFR